jgi:hypothetical protein
LIKSQNEGELYRIYRIALDGGADFNFLSVPASFDFKSNEIYDPKYQTALYAEGMKEGRRGIWLKAPPGQTPITVPETKQPSSNGKAPVVNSTPSTEVPQPKRAPTPPKPRPVASANG